MDVRDLAVVARAGLEALKFQKKKRAEAEAKAKLKQEAEEKAQAERDAALKEQAEADAEAEAEAEAEAKAEAEAETEVEAALETDKEAPPEPEIEAKPELTPEPEPEAEAPPRHEAEVKAQPEQIEVKAAPKKNKTKAASNHMARPVHRSRPAVVRESALKSAVTSIVFLALFLVYLVIEVVAAMAVYMYLNLNHVETFGYLISLSHKFFTLLTTYLEQYYPELANRAYATILGEMGAKSVLLLFLGLIVSAVTRFMVWLTGVILDGLKVRAEAKQPAAAPAEVESSAA
jgi:hypothetical protein